MKERSYGKKENNIKFIKSACLIGYRTFLGRFSTLLVMIFFFYTFLELVLLSAFFLRLICKASSVCMTLQIRVQAIRGLPLFCKDTPENIGKIVDILVQILASGKLFFSSKRYYRLLYLIGKLI